MKLFQKNSIIISMLSLSLILSISLVHANTTAPMDQNGQADSVSSPDTSKYVVRTIDLCTEDGTKIGTATGKMDPNADNVATSIHVVKESDTGYDKWKAGLPYTNNITCYDIGIINAHGSAMGSPITQGVFEFKFFVDPKYNGDTVYINADGSKNYVTSIVQNGSFSIKADVSSNPMSPPKDEQYPIAPVTQGAYIMYAIDDTTIQKNSNIASDTVNSATSMPAPTLKIKSLSTSSKSYRLLKAQMKDTKIIAAYDVAGTNTATKEISFTIEKKYNGKQVVVKSILPDHTFAIVQTNVKNGKVSVPVNNASNASTAYMIGIPQNVSKQLMITLIGAGVLIIILLIGIIIVIRKRHKVRGQMD